MRNHWQQKGKAWSSFYEMNINLKLAGGVTINSPPYKKPKGSLIYR